MKQRNYRNKRQPSRVPVPLTVSMESRVSQYNAWRDNYNPQRGLTIRRAVDLVESYVRGEYADLMWLFGAPYVGIEGSDPDYMALIELRNGKLLEMDWAAKQIADISQKDEKLSGEQQDFVRQMIDGIPNLYEGIEHLAMASYRGFSLIELNVTQGQIDLIPVDPWNVVRDGSRGDWKYNPEARQVSYAYLGDDLIIDPQYWLIREVKRPIGRFALLKYIRANLAEKDWDAFLEIYGVPGGIVIMPPNLGQFEDEYRRWAEQAAKGGSGALPHGATYTPNDQPRGINPFDGRLRYLTEKLVLAGTGGMLTMLSAPGSGTLAGGAHSETFKTLASGEARKISEVIQTQLIEPCLRRAFPGQPILAYFELAFNEETDTGEFIKDVATLATAGYQVDPAQVEEKTGYKVTLKPQPEAQAGSMLLPPVHANSGNSPKNADQPDMRLNGPDPRENDFATGLPAFAKPSGAEPFEADQEFEAQALELLQKADSSVASVLLPRVQEIMDAEDEEILADQLRSLIDDLPRILQADASAVDAWEKILSAALLEGITTQTS